MRRIEHFMHLFLAARASSPTIAPFGGPHARGPRSSSRPRTKPIVHPSAPRRARLAPPEHLLALPPPSAPRRARLAPPERLLALPPPSAPRRARLAPPERLLALPPPSASRRARLAPPEHLLALPPPSAPRARLAPPALHRVRLVLHDRLVVPHRLRHHRALPPSSRPNHDARPAPAACAVVNLLSVHHRCLPFPRATSVRKVTLYAGHTWARKPVDFQALVARSPRPSGPMEVAPSRPRGGAHTATNRCHKTV